MNQIDVVAAKELFELLHEPLLAVEERIVLKKAPALDASVVLELALQAILLRLDLTVNDQTFDHLRWKVVIARANPRTVIREASARARADDASSPGSRSRAYRDGTGTVWTVTEGMRRVSPGAEEPCLFFTSDAAVRCVKNFPVNWRSMSDEELSVLSWSR